MDKPKNKIRNSGIPEPKTPINLPYNINKRPETIPFSRKTGSRLEKDDDDFFDIPRRSKRTNLFKSEKKTPSSGGFGKALEVHKKTEKTQEEDDFRSSAPSSKLKLPTKRKKLSHETTTTELKTYVRASKENANDKDKTRCPYCSEILFPLTDKLEQALLEINTKNEKYEKEQLNQEIDNNSSFSTPLNVVNKRPVSIEAKDTFCKLHKLELVVKPQGVKKGYPTNIEFDKLDDRVKKFDDDLKLIIQNKCSSEYRTIAEDAYKKLGLIKARNPVYLMNRFEVSLPGYYGPKGSSIILSILSKLYMETGYLEKELDSPQLPLEFLQQVLVPEVGYRLIRQDLFRNSNFPIPDLNQKAKSIMVESREYGAAMFPLDNQTIEDDREDGIFSLTDDESDDDVAIIESHTISDSDSDSE